MHTCVQPEDELQQICGSHELFKKHSKVQLAALVTKMQRMDLQLGHTLFNAGDTGMSLWIVVLQHVL